MAQDFFNVRSVAAVVQYLEQKKTLGTERRMLTADGGIEGCVLAQSVCACEDIPMTNRSGMDGYAVQAQDTFGASEANPVYLTCIGQTCIDVVPGYSVASGQCTGIVTGGILPQGANAIVMVEYTHNMGADTIEVRRAVYPGQYVMLQGEDAHKGQEVLPANTLLRPQHIGLLAALGIQEVEVYRRPVVAIISSGDELVPVQDTPRCGQVRDVNTHTLASMIREAGGIALPLGIVRDDLSELHERLSQALAVADVIILSGGSSIGTRDHTITVLQQLADTRIFCHGVALSPGKPLILAESRGAMIWGLPGQVTSAQVVMKILGQPFLRHLKGEHSAFAQQLWPHCPATLQHNIASQQGREDYIRIQLQYSATGEVYAVPITGLSGLLRTLVKADGLIRIAEHCEGLEQGATVRVLLL